MSKVKWIYIQFYPHNGGGLVGYMKCIQHKDMLLEWFNRLKLKRDNIQHMAINGMSQSNEEVTRIFDWFDENLPEWRMKNEEREKSNQKAKRSNKSSKAKS